MGYILVAVESVSVMVVMYLLAAHIVQCVVA